ncbi:hypothetical protein JCM9279_004429 [Rhodotorula babjevae]
MAAASAASSPNGGFAVPRSRRSARGGTSTPRAGHAAKASTAAGDPDGDEAMTDDMRIAVSALGLMREGGSSTSTSDGPPPPPAASTSRHAHADDSSTAQEHYALPSLPSRYRAASSSRRSDPSRSTSTTSTASASETWTGATSDTGYSSPNGSASVAGTIGGDTDMLTERKLGDDEYRGDEGEGEHGAADPRFMARVSQLPVVSSGIEWYERSKANSRVVKYGAGLVESSFSAVSRPVANALPPLGPLDDFACRQLDRIGAPGASPGRKSPSTALHPHGDDVEAPHPHDGGDDEMRRSAHGDIGPEFEPVSERALAERASSASAHDGQQVATVGGGAGRSRWQTVLLEAGGLGAAVSEESLKSLRYCLQWLLYATAHLDHQIGTLRDFILSLRAHTTSSSASSSSNALVAASASAHLAQIKHDVVETIRKVVDVMSKYAGAALPEQAKRYVRQCILGLPVKWASAIEGRAGGMSGRTTRESTVDGSELGTPRPERMGDAYFPGSSSSVGASAGIGAAAQQDGEGAQGGERAQDAALRPTEEAADRILTFALESLDMLRSVTGIFSESVERAETWIERLRIVGLDRQRQQRDAAGADSDDGAMLPPALPQAGSTGYHHDDDGALSRTTTTGTKRRRTTPSSAALAKSGSRGSSVDAGESAAAVGATTAVEAGQAMDEGDEGVVTRRKRGAWRTEAAKSGAS